MDLVEQEKDLHVSYGEEPDLIILSKQITSNYIPMGVVLMTDKIYEPIAENTVKNNLVKVSICRTSCCMRGCS